MGALSFLKDVRRNIIYNSAVTSNKIREFNPMIDENLRNVIYTVLPAIIYIKYERPMKHTGNSQERAYLLSAAIPDSTVVVGEVVDIGEHFWVESGNVCYDPTSLLEYDKDVFYDINGIKKTQVISKAELEQTDFIQFCHQRKISDFENDPTYFTDLEALLPMIIKGIKYRAMPEYKKEIDDYLKKIGYYRKRDEKLKQDLFRNL